MVEQQQQQPLKPTRPKFYKLKQDINDFNYCYIEHQDQSINYFDYYMEFTPKLLKRIFNIGFLLNKLLIIILFYCVFYNTIWWFKNSSSNNFAINYQIIDSNIFFILIYINFHDFLINTILLRTILFHLLKSFHVISTPKLKIILNFFEILFKFLIICFNFLYLIYYAKFSLKFTILFILPHLYYLIYYSFNYEIKFLNYILFTNYFLTSKNTINNKNIQSQNDAEVSIFTKISQTSYFQIQKINLFTNHSNIGHLTSTTTTPTVSPVLPVRSNSPTISSASSSLTLLTTLKHCCLKDTLSLREETELFSKLFNSRFKEICLRTFEIIFYNLIIPRLCVPDYMNIRNFEFYSYVFIIIISTFISYWLYYIPMSALISLNRNAEHLGEWKECGDKKNTSICCWFDTKFYFKGDSINFMGKCYRVKSKFCISIPNYRLHKKFYKFFNDPFRIMTVLALLKLSCIILLGLVTYYEAKWYNIAVNMLYVIFNFHILYILTRDWIILYVKKYAKIPV
jgi:hypothetical protein